MLQIKTDRLEINFDESIGAAAFTDTALALTFTQLPSDARIIDARCIENTIRFFTHTADVCIDCCYEILSDETGQYIQLSLSSEDTFEGNVCYPPAIAACRGWREYAAFGEGLAYPVEDELLLPDQRTLYSSGINSMAFCGLSCENGWIMTAVITHVDAVFYTEKDTQGLYHTRVGWESEKGRWGYTRVLRYYLGNGNAVTGICRTYRKVAEQKGMVRTLREKAETLPRVDRLAGSANFWLWNNDAMEKLYSKDAVYRVPTDEQLSLRREIASDMNANGMTDVLWSIFDENVDRSTVEYIKSLGFLTTYYDVYTDVIPKPIEEKIPTTRRIRCLHRMPFWPEGIMTDRDGSLIPAWELTGIDGRRYAQHRLCDGPAIACAEKYVTEHGIANGIEGVFIDVAYIYANECWHPAHPQTRREALANKQKLFDMLRGMGLVTGTENSCEDAVRTCDYNEGILSILQYRFFEAGRRMARIYGEDEIDERIPRYMLNPVYRVPLWELVYHDCQTSYWYWGDSSNSVPSLMGVRDLFNVLYAQPPIYSVQADLWPQLREAILRSYHRVVPVTRKLRYARMTAFDYLTDDLQVQKTTFDDGTSIIANFSNSAFTHEGRIIDAGDFLVIGS